MFRRCLLTALSAAVLCSRVAVAERDTGAARPEFFGGYEQVDESPHVPAQPRPTTVRESVPVAPAPTRFTDRPLALAGMVGFGTPVGLLGGVIQYSLLEPVSVGAGIGTGAGGAEAAVIVDLRPLFWNGQRAAHAIGVGAAWSVGAWKEIPDDVLVPEMGHRSDEERALEQHRTSSFAQWMQLDAGYELRTKGGFVFRAASGVAWLVSPGDFQCRIRNGDEVPCSAAQRERTSKPFGLSIPTFTLSFGYAFGI